MKELAEIIKQSRSHQGGPLRLATVVRTEGSSYRRPGARMLIFPDDHTTGSISGGCLEQDVIMKSRTVVKTGKSLVLTYDTTTEEDILLGVGLGCNGVINILVEPILQNGGLLDFVEDIYRRRNIGAIATVIGAQGEIGTKIGDRLMLDQQGTLMGSFVENSLHHQLVATLTQTLRSGRPANTRHEINNGAAEIFSEAITAPISLVIFGAGYDAIPLVRLARELGFHITVVDHRPAYAAADRFPQADAVKVLRAEDAEDQLSLGDRTAAVIMSHNYLTDQAWLKTLLPLDLCYLGLMGPRKRAEKMLQELREDGFQPDAYELSRLHNPIGLDIGAESPEQIALSILSEIQAVITNHNGGLLCEKKGAIHLPREASVALPNERYSCLVSA